MRNGLAVGLDDDTTADGSPRELTWDGEYDDVAGGPQMALVGFALFHAGDPDKIRASYNESSFAAKVPLRDEDIEKAIELWKKGKEEAAEAHRAEQSHSQRRGTNPRPKANVRTPSDEPSFKFTTLGSMGRHIGEQTWLWRGWIPIGHLSMLFGAPEVGKTFLAQEIALAVAGQVPSFPDGIPVEERGAVLWLDYEGQVGTLCHRIQGAGLDPEVIHMQDLAAPGQQTPPLLKRTRAGRLEVCILIEQAHRSIPHLRLIVIDSLFGGSSGEDENKAAIATPLIQLAELASRLRVAILVLHHPRKPHDDGEDTGVPVHTVNLGSIRGNSSIAGVPRSILAIDRPVDSDSRRLRLVKASLVAEKPRAIGFDIEDCRIVMRDVPVKPEARTKAQACEEWLISLLGSGWMLCDQVEAKAAEAGFTPRMLKDVSRNAGIRKRRIDVSGENEPTRMAWKWGLPEYPT